MIAAGLFFLFRHDFGESRYSKSGNWADFDPGKDTDKVGNPKYPHAEIDNQMKEQFLNDMTEDDR